MTRKRSDTQDEYERDTQIALFRYGLIAQLFFAPLPAGQLEQALRQIAAGRYAIPYSTRSRVGISTLRRYLKQYQAAVSTPYGPKNERTKACRAPCQRSAGEGNCAAPGTARPHHPMLVELLKRDQTYT